MRFLNYFKELGAFPVMSTLVVISLFMNAVVIVSLVFLFRGEPLKVETAIDQPLELEPIEVEHIHIHEQSFTPSTDNTQTKSKSNNPQNTTQPQSQSSHNDRMNNNKHPSGVNNNPWCMLQ